MPRSSNAGRRPTIDDVATAAGVSRGTVSRALNGKKWVSSQAQRSVEAAASRLGYRPNGLARGLKTQRAGSVAFLLGESADTVFQDPNFAVIIREASNSLARRNLAMVLLLAGSPEEQSRALDFIATGVIDGVMLVSWHGELTMASALAAANVPVVLCGKPSKDFNHLSYVAADDYDGAAQMTAYLLTRGYERIAYIAPPLDVVGSNERVQGFRDVLGDRFDSALEVAGNYSHESGRTAVQELQRRNAPFDAIFAANDAMAAGAIEELLATGNRVPEDVAVAGFDDSVEATRRAPYITTMRQPFDRIMDEMTRLLVDQIDGANRARMLVATELIVRESA